MSLMQFHTRLNYYTKYSYRNINVSQLMNRYRKAETNNCAIISLVI